MTNGNVLIGIYGTDNDDEVTSLGLIAFRGNKCNSEGMLIEG